MCAIMVILYKHMAESRTIRRTLETAVANRTLHLLVTGVRGWGEAAARRRIWVGHTGEILTLLHRGRLGRAFGAWVALREGRRGEKEAGEKGGWRLCAAALLTWRAGCEERREAALRIVGIWR